MSEIHYRIRFLKGIYTALRIIISYKLNNLLGFFRSDEWMKNRLKKLHRRNAALIRMKALEMKGVMIKVGQFLSSRIDFLPEEYIDELSQLQDQVPPHDYKEIRQQIINSLGSSPENIFLSFDEVPIAAASLGQVHRAVLKDRNIVAVKIQYPDIDKIIETDIKMFKLLIRILRGRYGRINLEILHDEFSKIVRAELDYMQEGKSAERFRTNFSDDNRIIIPQVVWDYTKGKVLTLEYIEGIKITECETVKASGMDCREIVNLLAEAYSKMIFIHGFFHGDPHPGNIFVTEGPKLIFVDFGMVQAIPDNIRRELRNFANAIVERNTNDIINSLERMGFIIEGADYNMLTDVAQSLIDKYRNITPVELKSLTIDEIGREIENILSIIKYIQIPNNFILLGRTIGILNGIAFRLNPDVNIIEIGKPYIKEFLRGDTKEQQRLFLNELKGRFLDLWHLPSQMHDLLMKANRGDLSFKLAKSEMDEITAQFRSMTNVMMLTVLSVTNAAVALFFVILGMKPLAAIAAGASVIIGLLSVFKLMKG